MAGRSLSSEERALLAQAELLASPVQRVQFRLAEIERTAKEAQTHAEIGLPERQRAAEAAWTRYQQAMSAASSQVDEEERTRAADAFGKASNAIRPPIWRAARDALINVELARDALAHGKTDEAMEAAMRAVNAWWQLRTRQFEKPIRYGFEGLKARSAGGKKRAQTHAMEVADRNRRIHHGYIEAVNAGHSRTEAIKQLASRHRLSTKMIRRLVPAGTRSR